MNMDEVCPRSGTFSLKWDSVHSSIAQVIPLWVADMDFPSPTQVVKAVQDRAAHPIYGYTKLPRSYLESLSRWYLRRRGVSYEPRQILVAPGVMPSLAMALRALTQPGDTCLVMPPVYYPFFPLIRAHHRKLLECPLVKGKSGSYAMDWEGLEGLLVQAVKRKEPVKLLVFCSPHNPVGRVWTREELARLGALAQTYDFLILSDEIHGDLVLPPQIFVSTLDVPGPLEARSIVFGGPNKTFNLAGLPISHMIFKNLDLRARVAEELEANFFELPNLMALTAAMAAYQDGDSWLDEVLAVISSNYQLLDQFLKRYLPEVLLTPLEGTYLAWADFSPWLLSRVKDRLGWASDDDDRKLAVWIEDKAGVKLSPGSWFQTGGRGHLRFNLACPAPLLKEALERLARLLPELVFS